MFGLWLKKVKNFWFESKYSNRRIYTAGEKSLRVNQEQRDLLLELKTTLGETHAILTKAEADRVSYEPACEMVIMASFIYRTVVESRGGENKFIIYFIVKGTVVTLDNYLPEGDIKARGDDSKKYLEKILKHVENKWRDFFIIANLDDHPYTGVFSQFIWNYCGVKGFDGIVWPSLGAQLNFNNELERGDSLNWNDKQDTCSFFGSDTGGHENNPEQNDRIRLAILSNRLKDPRFNVKITNFVQINTDKLPVRKEEIWSPRVSVTEQLKSKILLSIDGNVSTWERVAWILNSNSLLFKMESDYYDWFYDHLEPDRNYVLIRKSDDIVAKIDYYLNNSEASQEIIKRGHELTRNHLFFEKHVQFTRELLMNYRTEFFG